MKPKCKSRPLVQQREVCKRYALSVTRKYGTLYQRQMSIDGLICGADCASVDYAESRSGLQGAAVIHCLTVLHIHPGHRSFGHLCNGHRKGENRTVSFSSTLISYGFKPRIPKGISAFKECEL